MVSQQLRGIDMPNVLRSTRTYVLLSYLTRHDCLLWSPRLDEYIFTKKVHITNFRFTNIFISLKLVRRAWFLIGQN